MRHQPLTLLKKAARSAPGWFRSLSRKQQSRVGRVLLAAAVLLLLQFLPLGTGVLSALCYLVPYLIAGWDVLSKAVRNIRNGQVFDENFLMSIATIGAFATGQYAEAVFVMVFYQTGEWFQDYAVGRSRQSIAELMDIRPDTANVEQPDGSLEEMDPEDVEAGSVIVVRPGERVPLDGTVLAGESSLDTAALTGEALPRDVGPGDPVISGCVNGSGLLRVRVSRPGGESTVARILELVENAGEKKASSEQFITRFARYYTPCVVAAAALLALIPPIMTGNWGEWFHRALIFLVVSCPCALVISVPLSFFGGIGGASRCGILVKGGVCLEALAKAGTVAFDKTGTLTRGQFTVTDVEAVTGFSPEAVLEIAALAEAYSSHPIAQSVRNAYEARGLVVRLSGRKGLAARIKDVEETAGFGVRAMLDGREICVGSRRLLERCGVSVPPGEPEGAAVYVAANRTYLGRVLLKDLPKPDAKAAIEDLRRSGVAHIVLLTGDGKSSAAETAADLGIHEYYAELLPEDKAAMAEKLSQDAGGLCFVGDGINDAPVLARADVGVAMGALGSDAAIEAADVVLMDDRPSKLATAVRIARKTMGIVRQNVAFSLAVKAGVLILGAAGLASMWLAVFADVGVAFLAILNAMRCLRVEEFRDDASTQP